MPPKKEKWYAYFVPPSRMGVTAEWRVCESMVKGVPGARYKAFTARRDADAWLAAGAKYEAKPMKAARRARLVPGVYFDAGTGRGAGVEVSVTDEHGTNLLHEAIPARTLNAFGKHRVDDPAATNNYGELLALRYALEIAEARGVVRVFGDSRLVIDYWSRRRIKRNDVAPETVALAETVARMREAFEAAGGTVERISGDDNPADLGFHS